MLPPSHSRLCCLGYHEFESMTLLSPTEKSILQALTSELWPGPLVVSARSNGLLPSNMEDVRGRLTFCCPATVEMRKLRQLSNRPLLTCPATMFPGVYCSSVQHVTFAYKYATVQVVQRQSSSNQCPLGFDRTHIEVSQDCVRVVSRGMVTQKLLHTILQKHCPTQARVVYEPVADHCEGAASPLRRPLALNHSVGVAALVPCYAVNFMDCSVFPSMPSTIVDHTTEFLSTSVLVDFHSLGFSCRDKCLAYVDLSSSGDYKEALFNLYNVFYEIRRLPHTKILFYNLAFISIDTTIFCGQPSLVLPRVEQLEYHVLPSPPPIRVTRTRVCAEVMVPTVRPATSIYIFFWGGGRGRAYYCVFACVFKSVLYTNRYTHLYANTVRSTYMSTYLLIDTSYTIFYRFYATKIWYNLAHPGDKFEANYDWFQNTVFR